MLDYIFLLFQKKRMKMKTYIAAISMVVLLFTLSSLAKGMVSESPENAELYFIQPINGETVKRNFVVKFGLKNMGVAPAGTDRKNTGHHHLLIDTDVPLDMTKPLPATNKIKHFGGGNTETEISLSPGKHTLQLILGNHVHIPHNKPVISKIITIEVK
jgi:hypothetical protein